MKSKNTYGAVFSLVFLNCLILLGIRPEACASGFVKTAIQFTENRGQWETNVLFKADIPVGNLFIEKNCLTYLFVDKESAHEMEHGKDIKSLHFHSVKVKFVNANLNPQIVKEQKSEAYYNYFVGNSTKWASNVYAYKKVILKNIYPKTDLEIIAQGDGIKINFVLQAGADPNAIELQYLGADALFLKENQLHVTTSLGELLEDKPVSFQATNTGTNSIPTKFELSNNHIKFKLNAYNPALPITIDPSVVFGTYVGSAADNFGFAASYDDAGNAYGAGTVYAANFPFTTGAFDVSYNGGSSVNGEYARDAFIVKFNPTGTTLLFGTFLGGTDNEQPHSVTISNGEIIVFGTTNSADFPVTNASYDKTYNGGSDIFVLKLNAAGNNLMASTYIGGSQDDGINGIAHAGFFSQTDELAYNYADWFRGEVITDLSGSIYLTTCTKSSQSQGLPLINASQSLFGGGTQDGYMVKLNNSLSLIQFSTYIGGAGADAAYSICVNNLNEIIIGGGTESSSLQFGTSGFPFLGGTDGFIAKFSSSGTKQRLIYTGTSNYDQVFFVQTDDQNNIYTLGQTKGNMPKSPGVYGVANAKQFLQKYNSSLTTLTLSTTFGKAGTEPSLSPSAFLVDVCGRVYVSGWGGGTNQSYHNGMDNVFSLPTTSDAFQKSSDGSDFYLMVLSPNFGSLLYATFYGGGQSQEHVDGGTSHFDKSGVVYQAVCAGCGGLNDFPTTVDAYSRINPGKRAFNTNIGGCNLGLFKFDMRTYLIPPEMLDTVLTITAGQILTYNFTASDMGGDLLTIEFSGNVLTQPNPAVITINSNVPGLISATLTWKTLCIDYLSDTIVIDVTVKDAACPVPNEIKRKIKIVVRSIPIPPPFPECIKIVDDNSIQLKWINGTPNSDYLNFQIVRSSNNGNMKIFDSVQNQSQNTYLDIAAPDNLNTNYCYQLITLNSCRRQGDSSRVICSIYKDDTISGNYFNGIEDELFVLHAFDTFNRSFIISSLDPKDSVFMKVNGSFVSQNKGTYSAVNGLSAAKADISWIPDCNDIYKDTIEVILNVRDNTCPNFRQAFKSIFFYVVPPVPADPPNGFCPKKISTDSVFVEWYPFQMKPATKNLYLMRKVNGVPSLIATFSDLKTTSFIDKFSLNPSNTTCYELTSNDLCNYFGDTGIAFCAQNNSSPAPTLSIYTATVSNDREIHLVWQQAKTDSFWRYQIWKKAGRNGGSFFMENEIRNLPDTVYVDRNVNVDENSYCYKLVNVDLCGNQSVNNKEACTILLTGNAEPFVNSMSWMPYDYWSMGINRYEILKTEPGIYSENLFGTTGDKPLMAIDNKLNYDNGLYQYTVMAYENIFGNKQTSESNTIDLIQLPYLYAPNAFTDNNDGLNDVFRTVPVFVRDYYLQVYNRWGARIFETRNKKEGFSGIYKTQESQEDVYFYIVEYTGWDNEKHVKKGNFTLLR